MSLEKCFSRSSSCLFLVFDSSAIAPRAAPGTHTGPIRCFQGGIAPLQTRQIIAERIRLPDTQVCLWRGFLRAVEETGIIFYRVSILPGSVRRDVRQT
jgi:hypothetical protein